MRCSQITLRTCYIGLLYLPLSFRLAHLQCESLLFRSPRLLSVSLSVQRQISETTLDRREISSPLWEIGVANQDYDVVFCTGSS